MTYQEQLKDPRWQKKRLEIMERDEWTCQMCGDTEATLTVHHKSYKFDGGFADIWDYDGGYLITLCETCHSDEEGKLTLLQDKLYYAFRRMFENADAINDLGDLVYTVKNKLNRRLTVKDILKVRRLILRGFENG